MAASATRLLTLGSDEGRHTNGSVGVREHTNFRFVSILFLSVVGSVVPQQASGGSFLADRP